MSNVTMSSGAVPGSGVDASQRRCPPDRGHRRHDRRRRRPAAAGTTRVAPAVVPSTPGSGDPTACPIVYPEWSGRRTTAKWAILRCRDHVDEWLFVTKLTESSIECGAQHRQPTCRARQEAARRVVDNLPGAVDTESIGDAFGIVLSERLQGDRVGVDSVERLCRSRPRRSAATIQLAIVQVRDTVSAGMEHSLTDRLAAVGARYARGSGRPARLGAWHGSHFSDWASWAARWRATWRKPDTT